MPTHEDSAFFVHSFYMPLVHPFSILLHCECVTAAYYLQTSGLNQFSTAAFKIIESGGYFLPPISLTFKGIFFLFPRQRYSLIKLIIISTSIRFKSFP